jgi:Uncharacterized protein conserved in bacteria (DUF2252)
MPSFSELAEKTGRWRVLAGAWHLSPALGDRMLAATLQDRSVFLRELLPQDLKFEIEHLTLDEANQGCPVSRNRYRESACPPDGSRGTPSLAKGIESTSNQDTGFAVLAMVQCRGTGGQP